MAYVAPPKSRAPMTNRTMSGPAIRMGFALACRAPFITIVAGGFEDAGSRARNEPLSGLVRAEGTRRGRDHQGSSGILAAGGVGGAWVGASERTANPLRASCPRSLT